MTIRPDYAALFVASPYPYLLIDPGFVIIGANPAYLRTTGRAAQDIVGKPIFDAFPVDPDHPESTNLDEVRASIKCAIATRQPHTSALLRYAIPVATAGGGVSFEERYWSAVHSPVLDDTGEVLYVAQTAIDVTSLYRFDPSSGKYYLKQEANAVPDIEQMNRLQMHETMVRILNDERSQLQNLFDHAPGFIAFLSGADHTFDMVNEAFYRLVGRRPIIGKPAAEALPELVGQGFKELLDQAARSGEPVVLRERRITLYREPGAVPEDRYVDLLFQPMPGHGKRVMGIFVQGNDVSGAYHANRALSEKVQQLEAIRSSQAFQLELADRIRQLDDPDQVMEAACELLGRKLGVTRVLYAEVDDTRGTLFIRRDWNLAGSASLAGQTKTLDDFGPDMIADLRGGRAVANGDVRRDPRTADHVAAYDKIGVRADLLLPLVRGSRLRVVLTIHNATAREWREDEVQLAQDMAERTWSAVEAAQAQAALRAERDQSQYIFDSMAEGFAVLDRDWTIVRMNAEGLRLTQTSASQVIGRSHWDVFPHLKNSESESIYRRVMATGKTEIIETLHVMPDGTEMWSEVRTHRSLDGGIAFFFRDVTERRLAQEQLKTADRRKDEFLAMLAHELRNPLAPIGAAAQLLRMGRLDEARVRHTSQIIGRQVDHMTHLINDLLDVSRVTRGLVTLDNAAQDVQQVVMEAVEQVTPLIQARRHQLALHLPPQATSVIGDKKRLVQVFTNILANAAKYTDEGGSISLRAEVDGAHVRIEVTDNGIGMAPELAAHVFELFAQAERSSDRSAGGLGLGLALVKSLVELHKGTVACHSDGAGQGSTFSVCLPRLAAQEHPPAPAAGEHPLQAGPHGLRILIVDDNADAAAMLAMLLEASGHQVAVEHDARKGLARAQADQPDACLLDIGLPDMDGNELARRLRALPETAGTLLIAVTGYGQEADRQRTAAAGFDHHLVKPLDPKQLFAILGTV
ncbi:MULTISPECIES: PAS domain-containing protein [unclassified Massilia]|uniref:hybrid sensor histidine kinase/response regulator n=1 Tax=unclassified Massilia TaxID=2609279 RepID=UPI001786D368|nr:MULTISPECIES: PAS domain-containing protein [unclassified Massilia]MBD8529804.1 PAS domain-containing protein [Massilia sp. CFBP 13647]MBD8672184.1 PAS domain-containing protein [Massilia sp. CFBP 13721]